MKSNITRAVDEVVDLKVRAVDAWYDETVVPLLKEIEAMNKRIFEREYKKVLELEEAVK